MDQIAAHARKSSPSSTQYWEAKIDPDGELTKSDRVRRAEDAKREHFRTLARSSARARRNKSKAVLAVHIVGEGAHARDIAAIVERTDNEPRLISEAGAKDLDLRRARSAWYGVVGINDPQTRSKVVARHDAIWWPVVDPTLVAWDAHWGDGCVIAPIVVMLTDVQLGAHVHVNYGATMTRCTIGDFTTIAPGVTICGDVTIGERCLIGAGSTIKNLVTIGNDVTVGCGAVVVKDVPDGATVMGNPAK